MLNKNAGKVYEGTLDAKGLKFGIVCGRFNDFFVSFCGGIFGIFKIYVILNNDIKLKWRKI